MPIEASDGQLGAGRAVNRIQIRKSVKHWVRVALDRMLETSTSRF
jgi:hypothetical protein